MPIAVAVLVTLFTNLICLGSVQAQADPPVESTEEPSTTASAEDSAGVSGAGGSEFDDPGDPADGADAADPSGAGGEAAAAAGPADVETPVEVPEVDAGTYAVRLRDLEQRINELKEQVFRSKARLSLLAETVLQGVVAGSQAVIQHENRMSSSYRLVKAVYALDGAPIFSKADEEGEFGEREQFDVYNGSIVPGEHVLTVNLEYRGHGYGIFSYLKGYRFKVRSTYAFNAPEGKSVTLRVIGYEKGGPTAPLEERPAVRYVERIEGGQGQSDGESEEAR